MRRLAVACRRGDYVVRANGTALGTRAVCSSARQNEEHFLIGVMGVTRKCLLARRHDVQLAPQFLGADQRADAPELRREGTTIAEVAQRNVCEVDDRPRSHPTLRTIGIATGGIFPMSI